MNPKNNNNSNLVANFTRVCTLATFLQQKARSLEAGKLGVSLHTLAEFKYILPDEIVFELNDEFDPVFSKPERYLQFSFTDRKVVSGLVLQKRINERVKRFENSFKRLQAKYGPDLDTVLADFAKQYLADRQDGVVETHSNDLKGKSLLEIIQENGEFVSKHLLPKREAVYGDQPDGIDSEVKLYFHQSKALNLLLNGENLIISTATASGKSLIFQSIVKAQLKDDETAMFVYPTKALAQDQLRSFNFPDSATFDGDLDFKNREEVLNKSKVLFVNPDILHTTICANWPKFADFLGSLKFVVLDEVHYYTGVLGAHVAMVTRRLRRLVDMLGGQCQFIGCSATLNKPAFFFECLTGLKCSSVTSEDDGSPSAEKEVIFCAPKYVNPKDVSQGRAHPIGVALQLMQYMVQQNLRVIAFCRTRTELELMLKGVYEIEGMRDEVVGYRGGYTPQGRRELEHKMFSNQVKGIVATTALEVGIDIGGLDCALIVGFPYSVASFRQQIGRVGRRQKKSTVVYITGNMLLDEYYVRNPSLVLYHPVVETPLVIHSAIAKRHIKQAAKEQPLTSEEFSYFPGTDAQLTEISPDCFTGTITPFSIRAETDDITLVIDQDSKQILEHIEYERLGFTVYEGGIFIHQGVAYLVVHVDADFKYAYVKRTTVRYTTRQRDFTDVDPLKTYKSSKLASLGLMEIKTTVFGFFKFDQKHQIIGSEEVNMPPVKRQRDGIWLNLSYNILNTLETKRLHVAGSIHAAEHVILQTLAVFIQCMNGDIHTECKSPEKELMSKESNNRVRPGRLVFYETSDCGILTPAFEIMDKILELSLQVVNNCQCSLGCANCITWAQCTESNKVVSKQGALVILRMLLNRGIADIPDGPEDNLPGPRIRTVQAVSAEVTDIKAE